MPELRWFPPAWLLIRTAGEAVMYVDPAWIQSHYRRHPAAVVFSHWPEPMDGLPEADLPIADVVLVTHHHQDHVKTDTVRRLSGPGTVLVAPARCARLLERPFRAVEPGDEVSVAGFEVLATPAHNTPQGRSTRKQHRAGECVGYRVIVDGRTVYHAGDTDVLASMGELGPVDVAFLPVGGTFTMDVDEAVEAAAMVGAGLTVPMHWGKTDPAAFVTAARAVGLRSRIPTIGEQFFG